MNARSFRSADANHDQLHLWVDAAAAQQAREHANQQRNVLVAPMLGDAQEKRFALRSWDWRVRSAFGNRLDAVIDQSRLSRYLRRRMPLQLAQRGLRDADNCVHVAQALLQNHAIEQDLANTEVDWNLVGIHVVQRCRRGRWTCRRIHGSGIGEMHNIHSLGAGQRWKTTVVPEVST